MRHRSDTVRSITLIIGSAFAAVGLTTFVVMAREKPAEPTPEPTEATTVVFKPMSASGFLVGRVEGASEEKAGTSRSIVVRGRSGEKPVVFVDGIRLEGDNFVQLLRDANPSFNVNIQPISDAPRDAGSRSAGKNPDGNDR